MIKLDGMLMISSARANIGKTELACALIEKFSQTNEIIGIKVTAISDKNAQRPRGSQGCGVCSSLSGNFCITEELGSDSSRMGIDKSVLAINSKPMVEIIAEQLRTSFSQTLTSAHDAEKFAFLGLQIVRDRIQKQGAFDESSIGPGGLSEQGELCGSLPHSAYRLGVC